MTRRFPGSKPTVASNREREQVETLSNCLWCSVILLFRELHQTCFSFYNLHLSRTEQKLQCRQSIRAGQRCIYLLGDKQVMPPGQVKGQICGEATSLTSWHDHSITGLKEETPVAPLQGDVLSQSAAQMAGNYYYNLSSTGGSKSRRRRSQSRFLCASG